MSEVFRNGDYVNADVAKWQFVVALTRNQSAESAPWTGVLYPLPTHIFNTF